jgi:hypothetical protein
MGTKYLYDYVVKYGLHASKPFSTKCKFELKFLQMGECNIFMLHLDPEHPLSLVQVNQQKV